MKKLVNKKHYKSFIYAAIGIIIFGSLLTFITVFFNKQLNISLQTENDDENDTNTSSDIDNEYSDLEIGSLLINNTNVSSLVYYENTTQQYYFSKTSFKENIMDLVTKAIELNSKFTDELSNYSKNLKYIFTNEFKAVTINLYLSNKLIKQKKYKSFFKLIIN